MTGFVMRNQNQAQGIICARLQELGFAREKHIKLYGEEFHLISDPVPDGDGFVFEGTTLRSRNARVVRIPLSLVQTLSKEVDKAA